MPFSPPSGLAFHTADAEVPAAGLVTALQRVAAFLQSLPRSTPHLWRYEDWWEHDGLHFDRGRASFHDLFAMIASPRSVLEATPDDFRVYVGVAPEDGAWYLRFRAEWDDEGRHVVGAFGVVVPAAAVNAFRTEVASRSETPLAEDASDAYYASLMA
jgi:hypothetical protein